MPGSGGGKGTAELGVASEIGDTSHGKKGRKERKKKRRTYLRRVRVGTAVGHGEQSGTVVTEAKVLVCAGGKVDERRGKIGWRKGERTSKMGGEGTYPGRWDRR